MAAQACLRVAVVLLALLGTVPSVFAHAQLLSTVPPANALVEIAPDTVELRFNEPVSPLTAKVIAADGRTVDLTDAAVGGETVSISLPKDLPRGTQVLSWRVVSTDGHPIGGTLIFSIGEVTGATAPEITSDRTVSVLLWLSKALLFVALFGGVGGALFGAVAASPPAATRVALGLSVAGLVLAPMTLGLQGLDALGLSLTSVLGANVWSTALSTSYGPTVVALLLAFLLAAASLQGRGRVSAAAALLAGIVGAAALALSGHASAAAPQWVTRPAVFLHIAGVLFWVGALLPLWLLMRSPSNDADKALAAFSRIIPLAVAPLVISGLTLAFVQMGPPGESWLTPYAGILATKLVLLVVLFGLALWNRRKLTGPALKGDALARYRLRRSIGVEMIIVIVILGLVAAWRFTPPPRALADVAAAAVPSEPIMEHLIDGKTMVMLTLTPGAVGPVAAEIFVADLEHAPKEAQAVSLSLSSPQLGIEPIKHEAVAKDGIWLIDGLIIPTAGTWHFEVEVRLSRFELARPGADIAIP